MKPHYHLLFGILFAIAVNNIFGYIAALLFLFSTVFIDVDHYIYSVVKTKNFSLKGAYKYHLNRGTYEGIIFHTIEFFILMIILSYFIPYAFFIFIGMLFHLSLDFIDGFKVSILRWCK